MQTLQQEYAKKIYDQVEDFGKIHSKGSEGRKQYGSMAHKLPVLVRQAGLIQALTFVDTRGKDAHKELLVGLAQVVSGQPSAKFLAQCRNANVRTYTLLTRQVLIALEWYKRFAQSVLDVDPTDGGEGT